MLSCIVGKTEITSFGYDDKQLREWSKKEKLICPVCGEPLRYYNGELKSAHFKHLPNSECVGEKYSEKDTQEHNEGKIALYNWLNKQENMHNLKLEHWISETKQRADIYFEHNSEKYVIEYQCSSSTNFKERTQLYKLNDINVIWVLGVKDYNDLNNKQRRFKALEKEIKSNYSCILYFDGEQLHKLYDFLPMFKDGSNNIAKPFKDMFNFKYESRKLNDIVIDEFIIKENIEFNSFDYITKEVDKLNQLILNKNRFKYDIGILSYDESQWGIKIHRHDKFKYTGFLMPFDKERFNKIISDLKLEINKINEEYKIEYDCDYIKNSIQQHIDSKELKFKIYTINSDDRIKFIINTNRHYDERYSDVVLVNKSISEINSKSGFKNECYEELVEHIDKLKIEENKLKTLEVKLNEDCVAVFDVDNYDGQLLDYIPFKIRIYDAEFEFKYRNSYKDPLKYTDNIKNILFNLLNKCMFIYDNINKIYEYVNVQFKIDDKKFGTYGWWHTGNYNLSVILCNKTYNIYKDSYKLECIFEKNEEDILNFINDNMINFKYNFDILSINTKLNEECYCIFDTECFEKHVIPLKFKVYNNWFEVYVEDNEYNLKRIKEKINILLVNGDIINNIINQYSKFNFHLNLKFDECFDLFNLVISYHEYEQTYEIEICNTYDNYIELMLEKVNKSISIFNSYVLSECITNSFIKICNKIDFKHIHDIYYLDKKIGSYKTYSTNIGVCLDVKNKLITYSNYKHVITYDDLDYIHSIIECFICTAIRDIKSKKFKELTSEELKEFISKNMKILEEVKNEYI